MAAILTGDRYLESLLKFVENNTGPLIEGTLVLKLNPVGLHYVESRLESLAELERQLAGAPVDYFRAYVSDLGDHRALEQLRRILRILTSLKVVSVVPLQSCRDPTPLCLLPFGRLKVLELRGCDLSASGVRGILELRFTLEKIICHNSTDALRHVFASRIAEIEQSPQWKRLSFVSCAYNGLVLMDDSLRLLPAVETLDLSRNKFSKVDNLWRCSKLKHLDLGYNQLRTIASFSKVSYQIVKLVLRNNALTTIRGVENLKSLEGLDLSYNIISNFSELELLAGLPLLQNLWLEGNPVCSANWYRAHLYSFFSDPDKLILDDKKISTREVWKRQVIIARRHKQPASFGFYSPAKHDAEGEGSVHTKMRKLSRVASIESETSVIIYSDDDSITCDDEDLGKHDIADLSKEAEIVDIIKKIECMKRERSALWLDEFHRWMTYVPDDHMKGNLHSGIPLIPSKEKDFRKKRRIKRFGKKSRYISGSADVFENVHRLELQESYYPYDDLSVNTASHETEYGPISNRMKLKSYHAKNGIKVKRREMTILDTVSDIIEAHSPSVYTGSPPHYQEDILHRRHNLEEEFLQLSVESYSVPSSDSDTSDSGNEQVEIGSPVHNESTTAERSKSMDSLSFFSCEDLQKTIESDLQKTIESDSCDGEIVGLVKQESNWLDQKMRKRKPKTRVVSLDEMTVQTDDDDNDSHKFNYSTHYRHEEASISDYQMLVQGGGILPEKILSGPGTGEFISKNFKVDLANFGVEETCRQYVSCHCLFEDPSGDIKSGMALLLICEQKLYVVLLNGRHDGSGSSASLVGCLGTEDVKEVLVGLGLQAVRVYANRGARYMFITRSIEKSRLLISMLELFHSNANKKGFPLVSLDKIQVALFERDVCGGSKTNILQYSMVLFWNNKSQENEWCSRSLFVLGGHMLVCIEDISQFGFDSQDIFTPYFSLDTCCFIASALEMVIDTKERWCVTLTLSSVTSEFTPWDLAMTSENGSLNSPGAVPVTWKLRLFSEDGLLKFIALVKALHAGAGPASPLKIRYVS
ncbi:putative leucine-rich repeat domain superfamily [Helianthus annuus]|uniref:Leucine-rich repeat domain superfamily n=3 Tax=Helianthus annuus TaxID=4232 RepID=A0A251VC82_HELAN|nr:uncharacterized protein LOC110909307 isoform X1 [Helianthus annuus]KAF5767543.1 putative leucine-rich repeat domain superfamily [Helianthus annuus]KAJ0484437.1 putative leucine-rich repeat domain superfamily [Helianthus annuus]KAJ0654990.1 putative leucine-rich repeat domain superfamily [Helianthus annuus]KAJ0658706.1 putative leucine-rich repeat domain superfamily [Helianthus annuus]KAJ0852209.1 putative leucine-rich repeat domain superfamily [Helianthus annuus]